MKWFMVAASLVCGSWMCGACISRLDRSCFAIANQYGFEEVCFKTENFVLYGVVKRENQSQDILTVYIEGDGAAWHRKGELACDPTPRQPLALWLALRDPSAKILYLARPGQFLRDKDPYCQSAYWSLARYSEKVVRAFTVVIDRIKKRMQVHKIGLVGYSGGGVIAALLAARRDDVVWLVTVASNLDHQLWCAEHKVTPLKDSLEPKKFGEELKHIPQIHFVGGRDKIVSQKVVQSYVDAMPDKTLIKIVVKEQFDHHCCWQKVWPELLKTIPGR
ncbi:MAG: alpha/beta hydrolase [Deltaproteobacteria bacterium]|nr:alpha/beta hydrolase [Candidatus Tharpella sp.]